MLATHGRQGSLETAGVNTEHGIFTPLAEIIYIFTMLWSLCANKTPNLVFSREPRAYSKISAFIWNRASERRLHDFLPSPGDSQGWVPQRTQRQVQGSCPLGIHILVDTGLKKKKKLFLYKVVPVRLQLWQMGFSRWRKGNGPEGWREFRLGENEEGGLPPGQNNSQIRTEAQNAQPQNRD